MVGLPHLEDPGNRNHALVRGCEIIEAAPSSALIDQRVIAAFQAEPASMLRGLTVGDENQELEWIVEQLQRVTALPHALVGEICGEDWDRVQTIESRTPTGRGDNFEYDLVGTPCANVIGKTACIYPSRVADLFPADELLASMGIESYMGLPLFDRGGRPLGILVFMDQRAWSEESLREALSLVLAFRPRLEALMMNRRLRRDMQMLSQGLEGEGDPLGRLVQTFAHVMNVRSAFVARSSDQASNRMRTVATAVDGTLRDPVEYELADTRLSKLGAVGEILLRDELDQAWPQASTLASFPACAGLLLLLTSPDGCAIGQLGLLHDRPLNRRIGEQPVVRAFRQQIEFELHRSIVEAERATTERRMLELQRTEGLGILAGGIAHDFNNLLVGVLGNAELALADLPADSDDLREYLTDILDASRAAMQLCGKMLAYAGRTTVESKRFNLGAEVRDLARFLSASIPRTVELVIDVGEDDCWLDGDIVQIRQVLMNLITNAGDAIAETERPGRILVSASPIHSDEFERPIIGITGSMRPGPHVRLSVRDDGCGMNEATRARIFDPFFTTKRGGHGLGLAAMLGIVRAHRGTLTVDSEPGVGSCFTVYLPSTDPGSSDAIATPAPSPSATRDVRVLVVDDELLVRKVVRRMLERAHYRVVTAVDGLDALEIFERERHEFDCVVLDLGMPRLGGIETIGRLRALAPELPVIISSAYTERSALDAVADDPRCIVVPKPCEFEQLTGAIAKLLEAG